MTTAPAPLPPGHTVLAWSASHAALLPGPPGTAVQVGEHAALRAALADRIARGERIVVWSTRDDLADPIGHGIVPERVWDIAEAHKILAGGALGDARLAYPLVSGTTPPRPAREPLDLFAVPEPDTDEVCQRDGTLRSQALDPTWRDRPDRLADWARLAGEVAAGQLARLRAIGPRAVSLAHSESMAAVLCVELERDGLPIDRAAAVRLIAAAAGPRPRDEAEEAAARRARDQAVLALVPGRETTDLRNPAQVKAMLAGLGIAVTSTRAHRLEPYRRAHPVVAALLDWRKDERIATTYGYRWLDEHVGPDDRLRGRWSACDGGAGRMTASAGLHSLPTPMREAVAAGDGMVFVRADLGQIEPRVLAAISGDAALAAATAGDDLYAPVARALGVDRPAAKLAMLSAMYGGTAGSAGEAGARMRRGYPRAVAVLDEAERIGRTGGTLRTHGGRLLRLDWGGDDDAGPRGRFARNAIVQGAAAELFKAWLATLRHGLRPTGGRIVLCLHDEVLVWCARERAEQVLALVHESLADSGRRWSQGAPVRFVADARVVPRWDLAK